MLVLASWFKLMSQSKLQQFFNDMIKSIWLNVTHIHEIFVCDMIKYNELNATHKVSI